MRSCDPAAATRARPALWALLAFGAGMLSVLGFGPRATAVDWWEQEPPLKYQSSVSYRVQFVAPGAVDPHCRQLGSQAKDHIMGCVSNGVMVLPNPCASTDTYAHLTCHEIAHVNGWRH